MIRGLLAILLCVAAMSAARADDCAGGHASVLLLVDRTTTYDDVDRRNVIDAVAAVTDQLGPGDRLVVSTMTGSYTDDRSVFDRCRPGCPDEGFFASLLSTCRAVVARARFQEFRRNLVLAVADLLRRPEETATSDLFRSVAEAAQAFGGDRSRAPLRRMLIVSDLIENSPVLAEHDIKRLPPTESARRLRVQEIRAELAGVAVRVIGFGRDDTPGRPALPQDQRRRIESVWRGWLTEGGAGPIEIGLR